MLDQLAVLETSAKRRRSDSREPRRAPAHGVRIPRAVDGRRRPVPPRLRRCDHSTAARGRVGAVTRCPQSTHRRSGANGTPRTRPARRPVRCPPTASCSSGSTSSASRSARRSSSSWARPRRYRRLPAAAAVRARTAQLGHRGDLRPDRDRSPPSPPHCSSTTFSSSRSTPARRAAPPRRVHVRTTDPGRDLRSCSDRTRCRWCPPSRRHPRPRAPGRGPRPAGVRTPRPRPHARLDHRVRPPRRPAGRLPGRLSRRRPGSSPRAPPGPPRRPAIT